MKVKFLISICVLLILSACTKDQFTTKPQLTFKSVSTNVLPIDQSIIFSIDYTDKEGDIQDSLVVIKKTFNCIMDSFTVFYPMPTDIPTQSNSQGEIQVRYSHGINLQYPDIGDPQCPDNDTCVFKFVLSDKAGNISDTAYSPQIVIIKR
ncbi:MAG: hypothetical protein ABJA79_11715 [Parafilimonas sp.]